jgi:hypothetical protein
VLVRLVEAFLIPARASEVNNVVWEDCKVFRQNGRLKLKESRIESTPSEDVANIFFAAHCGCACRQRADDISADAAAATASAARACWWRCRVSHPIYVSCLHVSCEFIRNITYVLAPRHDQ